MFGAVVALIIAAVGAAGYNVDPVEVEFDEWMQKYSKTYIGDERLHRLDIFRENHKFVHTENAKGNTYELELNEFADQSSDEFATTHFGIAKPERVWGDAPYLGPHKLSGDVAPASVDWVAKGAVTPVKNQGQCGSCWSFSTTGSLEGAYQIAGGKLVSFSEQQFVDCDTVSDQGCNGGEMDSAFKYAEANAICTEDSYPYKAKQGTCQTSSCTVGLAKGSVTGFHDVTSEDTNALVDAVAQQPVSIAIEADKSVFQLYKSGVLTATCGSKLDHGVLAVGYGTLSGQDYWKVNNSWGPSWGMKGYVLLEKGKIGAGECGIKMQPSYPVVSATPGPSPGPSPPTPPPTPPTPGSSHYEQPPCRSDEEAIQIQGLEGNTCVPKCSASGQCPTDVPAGTTDTPQCILKDQSGNQYCAIACTSGGCPTGAQCEKPVGSPMGVCLYTGGPGPSPPPPPTPPAGTHYEKPPCMDDEQSIRIQGIDGYSVCSPKCSGHQCPSDEPAGARLPPQCMLKDTSGDQYCAIPCLLGGCPAGGACKRPSGSPLGLCMYADSSIDKAKILGVMATLKLNVTTPKFNVMVPKFKVVTHEFSATVVV